jgi:16S rRNA (cytidine1402-2'-O)-methyltransferase
MNGKLYLIPTTLGDGKIDKVLPEEVRFQLGTISHFIVENVRTARRFIKKAIPNKVIDELVFYELNGRTPPAEYSGFLNPALSGTDIGIISEAGNPGIADPGAVIVKLAHEKNIQVIPLVGPASILLALISSGMNGQNFAFNGYLPIERTERIKKIQFLESRSKTEQQSQIFMETPYRNMKLLEDLLNTCKTSTMLCIAVDITLETEFIKTKSIAAWKKNIPQIDKRPAIFIVHSG